MAIYLVERYAGGYQALGKGGDTGTIYPEAEGVDAPTPEPALILPSEASHALLAALARHLGAVEHPEQLRRDYEAERARVDRFIAHLTMTPR